MKLPNAIEAALMERGHQGVAAAATAKSLAEALSISHVPMVITSGTAPYKIVHTNKAWAELTGYIFTEVVRLRSSPGGVTHGP